MSVKPEVREQLLKDIAEEYSERMKNALKTAMDEGWLLFSRTEPAEQLRHYMQGTIVEELPLIVDPDYQQKLAAGEVQPLQSQFWALLLQLPFWDDWSPFREHQKRFKRLLDNQVSSLRREPPRGNLVV